MSLHFALPPELAEHLRREAERQALAPDVVALRLLDKFLPAPDHRAQTVALLQSWIDAETDEKDADYDLFRALYAARTFDRKLFHDDLKGTNW